MIWDLGTKFAHLIIAVCNLFPSLSSEVQRNVAYGPSRSNLADIYRPKEGGEHPVVVFFYGGGWRNGSKEGVAYVGAALARKGYVVVVPEYRHFPTAKLPDILADTATAVAWTIGHAHEFGGDARRVVVAGHSSGAWAATMLALYPEWLAQAGSEPGALAGVIGIAGPYAISSMTEQADHEVFSGAGPDMEPIHGCSPRQPTLLLLTGADDTIVLPVSTTALSDRIRKLGHEVETHIYAGLGHGQIVDKILFPFSVWSTVSGDIDRFVSRAKMNSHPKDCAD